MTEVAQKSEKLKEWEVACIASLTKKNQQPKVHELAYELHASDIGMGLL